MSEDTEDFSNARKAARTAGDKLGTVFGIVFGGLLIGFLTTFFPIEKELKPFDSTAENSTTILIPKSGYVSQFNHEKVKWSPGLSMFAKVFVPAGDVTIVVNYRNGDSLGHYNTDNINVIDTLSADKIYIIDFTYLEKEEGKKTIKSAFATLEEISAEEHEKYLQISKLDRIVINVKSAVFGNIGDITESGLVLAGLVLLGILYLFFIKSKIGKSITTRIFRNNDNFVENYINGFLKSASKKLPMIMEDTEMRWDSICALPDKVVQFHYTLVNYSKDPANQENLKNHYSSKMLRYTKTIFFLKDFRKFKVTMEYVFHDKNNNEIFKLTFGPKDYSGADTTEKAFGKSDTYIEKLSKFSEASNKDLPIMLESYVRFDTTCVLPNKIFQLHFTLLNYSKEERKLEDLNDEFKSNVLNEVKTASALKYLRDLKATIEYVYHDKNNNEVLKATCGPKDYMNK